MSNRAALIGVLTAFAFGAIATLAIRPPTTTIVAGETDDVRVEAIQAQTTWRIPVSLQTNLEVLGDNILYVADTVSELSDGNFTFLIAEPNEIVPPFAIIDAVRDQKVPAGYTWLGYDQGKIPASPLLGAVPFGMEPWEFSAWWYEAGGRELGQELYAHEGVHIMLCGLIGPETAGWFRTPIESLEDLQGLKIRFAGLGGKVIERLGASVTMLPGSEIFQALEKGAIDATEYSLPNVDDALGFDLVAKLNYFPGWHQVFTSVHFAVNIDVWNSLSDQYRSILTTACTSGVTRNLAKAEAIQGGVIKGFESKGVTANKLPDNVLRELHRITAEVMQEESDNNEFFRRIYASQTEFREEYDLWKQLAYLPRDF